MSTLRFEGQGHCIEIDASMEQDTLLQNFGDAYVQVLVRSSGFLGRNDLWLRCDELKQFAKQLGALDQALKGEAKLSSASPDELELTVRSVSSRGHVAVSGSTGYPMQSENAQFWHAVSFGFEFEHGQLSAALQASWLRHYVV